MTVVSIGGEGGGRGNPNRGGGGEQRGSEGGCWCRCDESVMNEGAISDQTSK